MSPLTHLMGSWLVAVATTNNPRDRKLVTWAGVLPDVDGLGAVADVVTSWISGKGCTFWFWKHQWRLDGWQNQTIFVVIFAASLWVAVKKGYSFLEVISARLDSVFVQIWFAQGDDNRPAVTGESEWNRVKEILVGGDENRASLLGVLE